MTETKRELYRQLLGGYVDKCKLAGEPMPPQSVNAMMQYYDTAGRPAIPKDIADVIERAHLIHADLWTVMNIVVHHVEPGPVLTWYFTHADTFARAWLDGYTVEANK